MATFKSGVDLVSVTAVVRDKKGKVVRSLDTKDFMVAEDGKARKIISIQSDVNAPASIAFLVDSSGSMALGAARQSSAAHLRLGPGDHEQAEGRCRASEL